jgi:predicted nucleic acid-binding protein
MAVIDTNVVSDSIKPAPLPPVLRWVRTINPRQAFICTLGLGEIVDGVSRLRPGARKSRLETWTETEVRQFFRGRILPVSTAIAEEWGRLRAQTRQTMQSVNALLATSAIVHDLIVFNRNAHDFEKAGVRFINPWQP